MIKTMPVPNNVTFGPHLDKNEPITYGDLRKIEDKKLRVRYLKRRIDQFLNNQTKPLYKKSKDELNYKSPFPLALLTCIGIETLGQIIIKEDKDKSNFQFKEILNKFDKKFSNQLPKSAKKALENSWENYDRKKIKTISELIHSYFRNTMVHGYRGKGVFLSVQLEEIWKFDKETGFITINPIRFWETYLDVYDQIFSDLLQENPLNSKYFDNCQSYIDKLLK